MAFIKLLLINTTLLCAATLSVQNAAPASVQFFVWRSISMPVGLLLVACVCVGIMLSGIVFPVRGQR